MPRNPNCEKCILHRSSKNVCVWGSGEGEGFLVGEAPGQAEAATGRPFMGDSGKLMRPILAELGLPDPFITNVAKCRPPKNRKPEPEEIKACREYLDDEIATKKPKAILLLGATAMKALIGRVGITEMNGQIVEKDGQTYVCSFHPAYVLRDPSKLSALKMALGRYAAVLKGEFDAEMPSWRPIDKESIDTFIADWHRCETFTFDVETGGEPDSDDTSGLQWWKEDFHIYSIAFSFSDAEGKWERNWALSLLSPEVLPHSAAKDLMEYLVETQGKKKAGGQNAKFDCLCMLAVFGVTFRLDDDSMLAHHIIDENASHSLKPLARQYCGAPDYDLTTKEKKRIWTVPVRRRLQYNACDSAYTRRLLPIFKSKMDTDERWLYDKVVMPASRMFQRIERIGHYIDVEFLNNASREEAKKLAEVEAAMNKMLGRTINWGSHDQVRQALYGDLGIQPLVFTEKGKASTAEDALVDIDHPIAKLIEKRRTHDKFLSTYAGREEPDGTFVDGWREFMDGPYLYLSTKIHGTVTGRYASRFHQTPRDGTIRNAVTAPPGWTHGQLDLSQAELRVVAIMSRDPEMLRCFKAGEDIHWKTLIEAVRTGGGEYEDLIYRTARALTKKKLKWDEAVDMVYELGKFDPDQAIKIFKDWKEGRKKAKGINFGFVFGQSPQGFITYAKAKYGFEPTLEESTNFHAGFFNLYNAVPKWHERQKKLAAQDGFVRSMSGRKRRLPGIWSSDKSVRAEAERQAVNAPVQGFIGDYKVMIMIEVDEKLYDPNKFILKGEVHDSILFWVKNEYKEEMVPRLYDIAMRPRLARECGLQFPIQLTVDIELGRWGAAEKWKPS